MLCADSLGMTKKVSNWPVLTIQALLSLKVLVERGCQSTPSDVVAALTGAQDGSIYALCCLHEEEIIKDSVSLLSEDLGAKGLC